MFNNAQHHRRESLELNTVPISVSNEVPESSICKALSLTSHKFKPNDLQACHRLKKKYTYYDTYYDEYFERNDNSDTITNPCDISNTFNNYFASIAENIKKKQNIHINIVQIFLKMKEAVEYFCNLLIKRK